MLPPFFSPPSSPPLCGRKSWEAGMRLFCLLLLPSPCAAWCLSCQRHLRVICPGAALGRACSRGGSDGCGLAGEASGRERATLRRGIFVVLLLLFFPRTEEMRRRRRRRSWTCFPSSPADRPLLKQQRGALPPGDPGGAGDKSVLPAPASAHNSGERGINKSVLPTPSTAHNCGERG